MSPKKLPTKLAPKKVPITIMMKYEEGKRIIDIARECSKASSTIDTILKKEEDIKAFTV